MSIETEVEVFTSYMIEPNGKLHKVDSCKHADFCVTLIEEKYPQLLQEIRLNDFDRYTSFGKAETCKELVVGELNWITYSPQIDAHVGDVGRTVDGLPIATPFTKHQIVALYDIWEKNPQHSAERLHKIISDNKQHVLAYNFARKQLGSK